MMFSHLHAIRHLISGGYIFNMVLNQWRQVGNFIRNLIQDEILLKFIVMSELVKTW